jgi:hypothetical protein
MVNDLDETLGLMLAGELGKIAGSEIRDRKQITFLPPVEFENLKSDTPRVNLYLHDIRENLTLRGESRQLIRRPGESSVGITRPPLKLDLSYILTVKASDDPLAEHKLLSQVLMVLMRQNSVPAEYLSGMLAVPNLSPTAISVAQPDHHSNNDPASLWRALGGTLRPAISILVTAPFDPFETKWTQVVREAVFAYGPGVPPQDLSTQKTIRVSCAGVVVDQATEEPIIGARIVLDGDGNSHTRSDDRGLFFFLNLPGGEHKLLVEKERYQEMRLSFNAPAPGHPEQLTPLVAALSAEEAKIQEKSTPPAKSKSK